MSERPGRLRNRNGTLSNTQSVSNSDAPSLPGRSATYSHEEVVPLAFDSRAEYPPPVPPKDPPHRFYPQNRNLHHTQSTPNLRTPGFIARRALEGKMELTLPQVPAIHIVGRYDSNSSSSSWITDKWLEDGEQNHSSTLPIRATSRPKIVDVGSDEEAHEGFKPREHSEPKYHQVLGINEHSGPYRPSDQMPISSINRPKQWEILGTNHPTGAPRERDSSQSGSDSEKPKNRFLEYLSRSRSRDRRRDPST